MKRRFASRTRLFPCDWYWCTFIRTYRKRTYQKISTMGIHEKKEEKPVKSRNYFKIYFFFPFDFPSDSSFFLLLLPFPGLLLGSFSLICLLLPLFFTVCSFWGEALRRHSPKKTIFFISGDLNSLVEACLLPLPCIHTDDSR
jgi:hypothetical protein